MDAALKELAKLEKLASTSSSKGKSPSVGDSLDSFLRALRETKESVQTGTANEATFSALSQKADSTKKDIDDRQKEIYNSLAKFGKILDKVRLCCTSMLHVNLKTFTVG
jgi:E3 ubiquitin-protein transferase RMND5